MSKLKRASWVAPTAKDYVFSVLKQVGPKPTITPYISHALLEFSNSFLPDWIRWSYSFELLKKIQKKALKRQLRKGD
jgi:hypothetical protein